MAILNCAECVYRKPVRMSGHGEIHWAVYRSMQGMSGKLGASQDDAGDTKQ